MASTAEQRARWAAYQRERRARYGRTFLDRINRKTFPFKTRLCANARYRGRKLGLAATIRAEDLHWPEFCPVLGIRLVYPERSGEGGDPMAWDRPSLDRWDNTKGYVPGNVFVISMRANLLKNNGTARELEAVAAYARRGPKVALTVPPLFAAEIQVPLL